MWSRPTPRQFTLTIDPRPSTLTARRAAVAVAALTALAAALRLPGLDSGLWFDEIVTLVESVRRPLHLVLTTFEYNNHPLYSLLGHVSVLGPGEHAWSIRLPAYVFGVAAIPLMYGLAIVVTTRAEALWCALLLGVSYHHVWFSQNARGYTALLFFTLLASLLLMKLMQQPRAIGAVAYGLAAGLGIYTHLTMAFVVMAHVVIWGSHVAGETSDVKRWQYLRAGGVALAVTAVVSALLYLPMLGTMIALLSKPAPHLSAAVATPRWAVLETLRGLRVGFGLVGVLAAFGLVAVGILDYFRHNRLATFVFLLPGVMTGVVMIAARAAIRPRFFFAFLAFGLLFVVRGAMECGRILEDRTRLRVRERRIAGTAIVSVIAVLSAASLSYNYRYPKQDYDGALRFIESHRAPNESVVTGGLAIFPYTRYYNRSWAGIEHPAEFDALRGRSYRVWMVYSFEEYMDHQLVEQIRQYCKPQRTFPGTLGGGDVIVCTIEVDRSRSS